MSESAWVKTLAAARLRPTMFQGGSMDCHLSQGIRAPLRLMWEKHAFESPQRAVVAVSPTQYHCRCESGPLLREIERLVDWEEWDSLLDCVSELQRRLDQVSDEWARRFCESTFYLGAFSSLLYLAARGAVAIRTHAGLWCQTYERGWPQTPPFLVMHQGAPVGLMATAALSPQWCPGLPYSVPTVQEAIPEAARLSAAVEWHVTDDVIPECPVDPRCVLCPENIRHWL